MAGTNNIKWEDLELLKELGNLSRFKRPVPSKQEVETSNLNRNMYYEVDNNFSLIIFKIVDSTGVHPCIKVPFSF